MGTKIPKVTNEQIEQMAALGVSAEETTDQTVAERAGSDDKVAAATAEGAKPRVPTYTPDGRAWMDKDPYGLKTAGLYGQRGQYALTSELLQLHAQFRGSMDAVYLETVIHGPDPSAPASFTSTVSGKVLASFIRTAMIDEETGDLQRNKDGNPIYRGQFVVTGKPLAVHATETGDNLYQLRNARNRKKELRNGRMVADLLYAQSFDQANARLAGIQAKFEAQANEKNAMNSRLGFKVGDAVRHNGGNRNDDGIDRGPQFTPRTPRGESRKQPRRWADGDSQ